MAEDLAAAVYTALQTDITAPEQAALSACEALCDARGLSLFLVGGAVRDLLMGRGNVDLDLAVEGPVDGLARDLAMQLGGRAVVHERFGTAKVSGRGYALDLAQTRRETYARPGALPTVEPVASILDDLSRRDFTINSLALQLRPELRLVDPFGGTADLRTSMLRVLHEASFRDDATRMLRGARYSARLHLRFETLTQAWLVRDLKFLDAVSGPRLRRELALSFEEPAAAAGATFLASRAGILGAIHPLLRLDDSVARRWDEALATPQAALDELGFCLVAGVHDEDDVASLSRRLHLQGRYEKSLLELVRLRGLSAKLAATADDPVAAVDLLDGRLPAAVWALSLLDEGDAGVACRTYLERWRHVRPALTGDDLLALGLPAGEGLGALLRRLRRARLQDEVTDREGEIALVRAELRGGGA